MLEFKDVEEFLLDEGFQLEGWDYGWQWDVMVLHKHGRAIAISQEPGPSEGVIVELYVEGVGFREDGHVTDFLCKNLDEFLSAYAFVKEY